jgi:hypothetical protein
VRRLPPERRNEIEQVVGYGPGDAYIALWDEIVLLKQDRLFAAESLAQPPLNTRRSMEELAEYARDTFISTLISILPYERPKLGQIKFQGDTRGETTLAPEAARNDHQLDASSRQRQVANPTMVPTMHALRSGTAGWTCRRYLRRTNRDRGVRYIVDCTHNNKTAGYQREWPQRLMHGADSPRKSAHRRQQTSSKVSQSPFCTPKLRLAKRIPSSSVELLG